MFSWLSAFHLFTLLFIVVNCDPDYVHYSLKVRIQKKREFLDSINVDEYGEWRPLAACPNGGRAVYMRRLEVPLMPVIEFHKFHHHTLEFMVVCYGVTGVETTFSVDFRIHSNLTERYGYFVKRVDTINETRIDLDLQTVQKLAKADKEYSLALYNCHDYSKEKFEQIVRENMRQSQISTTTAKPSRCQASKTTRDRLFNINCATTVKFKPTLDFVEGKTCASQLILSNLRSSVDAPAKCDADPHAMLYPITNCPMIYVYFECMYALEGTGECTRPEYDGYYCMAMDMFRDCLKNGAFQVNLSLMPFGVYFVVVLWMIL